MVNDFVKLNVSITRKTNSMLDEIASGEGITKSELLRRAIALIELATAAKADGHHLAITNKSHEVLREIVGI